MHRTENVFVCVCLNHEYILTLSVPIRVLSGLSLTFSFFHLPFYAKKSQFPMTSTSLLSCFISIHDANIINNMIVRNILRVSLHLKKSLDISHRVGSVNLLCVKVILKLLCMIVVSTLTYTGSLLTLLLSFRNCFH